MKQDWSDVNSHFSFMLYSHSCNNTHIAYAYTLHMSTLEFFSYFIPLCIKICTVAWKLLFIGGYDEWKIFTCVKFFCACPKHGSYIVSFSTIILHLISIQLELGLHYVCIFTLIAANKLSCRAKEYWYWHWQDSRTKSDLMCTQEVHLLDNVSVLSFYLGHSLSLSIIQFSIFRTWPFGNKKKK